VPARPAASESTPTPVERRAFLSLGALGVLAMVQSAITTPSLWNDNRFLGGFILLSLASAYGAWEFFKHWKARAVGPAIIATAYALVTFGAPSVYLLSALAVAFVTVAYFVSPDRNTPILSDDLLSQAKQEAREAGERHQRVLAADAIANLTNERDALREKLATAERELQGPSDRQPLLRGEVMRFESVDARALTEEAFADLEREIKTPPFPRFWYVALLQIETATDEPSRAKDWLFSVKGRDFVSEMVPVAKPWGAPPSWPRIEYDTLEKVQTAYLQHGVLYNVLLHLTSTVNAGALDMRSFQARFTDSNGVDVICAMPPRGY